MTMVERWSIEPSPTRRDPKRHTLFLKADKLDIFALLRQFGSIERIAKASVDELRPYVGAKAAEEISLHFEQQRSLAVKTG